MYVGRSYIVHTYMFLCSKQAIRRRRQARTWHLAAIQWEWGETAAASRSNQSRRLPRRTLLHAESMRSPSFHAIKDDTALHKPLCPARRQPPTYQAARAKTEGPSFDQHKDKREQTYGALRQSPSVQPLFAEYTLLVFCVHISNLGSS